MTYTVAQIQRILEAWDEFVQLQLAQSLTNQFPIEDWLRCLRTVLAVAKGKNAAKVQELIADIQPDLKLQNATSIFTDIAPLILTKDGKISKRDFLGLRVETNTIEAEIDFLVRAAKLLPILSGFYR